MVVGIADRQDPVGLCNLLHLPLYILSCIFLTVLGGKAMIMEIEGEAKRV